MTDKDNRSPGQNNADRSYDVGYGKPPRVNQFKPGYSGNSAGRPKGHKSLKTIVTKVAQKKVTVRTAKGSTQMSTAQALVERTMNDALAGNQKSAQIVFTMMQAAGLGIDVADTIDAANAERLSEEDRAILNRHIKPRE